MCVRCVYLWVVRLRLHLLYDTVDYWQLAVVCVCVCVGVCVCVCVCDSSLSAASTLNLSGMPHQKSFWRLILWHCCRIRWWVVGRDGSVTDRYESQAETQIIVKTGCTPYLASGAPRGPRGRKRKFDQTEKKGWEGKYVAYKTIKPFINQLLLFSIITKHLLLHGCKYLPF